MKVFLDRTFDVFDGFADCFKDIRRCGRVYGGGAFSLFSEIMIRQTEISLTVLRS